MELIRDIYFYNDDCDHRLDNETKTSHWIEQAIESEGFEAGAISVIFSSPEKHIEINRQYLDHNYNTDVITFDYSVLEGEGEEKGYVSGDIFIDPATVAENAVTFGTDKEQEMLRVIIHGVLHLCGYDDQTDNEREIMRAKENLYLLKY